LRKINYYAQSKDGVPVDGVFTTRMWESINRNTQTRQ
jgi:hypothetical protein